MLMWRFLWCLLLVIPQVSVAATAQKPLKLPFLDWGACPFECCTYRDWVASENMTAYSSRDENSTAVFKIKQNETVKAITGVVVTRQAGLVDILKTVKLGYAGYQDDTLLTLHKGERIAVLHYAGEGQEVFWYKGKTYTDEIGLQRTDTFKKLSSAKFEWWAKVRNRAGKIGWTKRTDAFKNQDSCG